MAEPTIEHMIAMRVQLRDAVSAAKAAYDLKIKKLKEGEQKCEAWLLNKARETGVTQFKVEGVGTAFISETLKVSCKDWPSLHAWVLKTGNIGALEQRVSKTFVKEFQVEHESLPPGVDTFTEQVINVRRSTRAKIKGE